MKKVEYLVTYKQQYRTTCKCTRAIFKTKDEVKEFIKSLGEEDKVLQIIENKTTILDLKQFK